MFFLLPYSRKLLLMFLLFFIGIIATSILLQPITLLYPQNSRDGLLISAIVQNIVMFVLPAIATSFFIYSQPINTFGFKKKVSIKIFFLIFIVMLLCVPALNFIINWNAQVHLPDYLKDIEVIMRNMEDSAFETTKVMLNTTSFFGLLSGVLIIGVLTGFGEELFFRGTMQRVIASNGMNPHVAIWLSAILFSILHFQFFGFIPRMLLGAFFGYLFFWTGSVWYSFFAHALNNSIVVVVSFLTNNGYINFEFDKIGLVDNGIPYLALVSVIFTVSTLYILKKYIKQRNRIR